MHNMSVVQKRKHHKGDKDEVMLHNDDAMNNKCWYHKNKI
jgi:hypothetical protein